MASITFPTGVIWAFNPTKIVISGAQQGSYANVAVGTNSIKVALQGDDAEGIIISRLVQMAFFNPESVRSRTVNIYVNGAVQGSTSIPAIWGCLRSDDKFAQFVGDDGFRRVQYFKEFPFSIDCVANGITTVTDNFTTKITVSDPIGGDISVVGVPRDETEGAYLRWVDRFGCLQYYLFSKGDVTLKTTTNKYSVESLVSIVGQTYDRYSRPLGVETTREFKMSAVSLDPDTLKYVSSIVGSPIVDMYLGGGKWIPVRVSDGSYTYSEHHHKRLQDFEICIVLPKETSQQL